MILREHVVNCNRAVTWNLYPIGDLQFGAAGFNDGLWEELVDLVTHDPMALTIGMGDYSDHWRPTNQAKLAGVMANDKEFKESFDEMYRTHNRKIYDKISKVFKKGRCLGLLSGHHEYTYSSGITSTQELCEWLGVPYLSELGVIRLVFKDPNPRSMRHWRTKIHAQHGQGGSSFINSDVPNIERKTAPFWNADIFLRGHSTKKWAAPIPMMDITSNGTPRLVEKTKWMVNTGGFMKGYIEGQPTYVSRSNMPPASLGYVVVHLRLERRQGELGNYIRTTVTQ
jgi:hypothetical protein